MSLGQNFPGVLDAARTGAEWAVAAMYQDLCGPVLRYLTAQIPGEAEDLASETWIDVARGLHRFQGEEPDFRRYVFAIARRRLVDHLRMTRRRRTAAAPAELIEPHLPAGDVEAEAMEAFSERQVLALVARLPREQAEVVLLRVVGGFTAEEVANLIGKRAGTVRVLQHRALAKLAADLAREGVTPESLRAM
jgi:RNA polymerase sigma-70 factor (ECF subfamily)